MELNSTLPCVHNYNGRRFYFFDLLDGSVRQRENGGSEAGTMNLAKTTEQLLKGCRAEKGKAKVQSTLEESKVS